MTDVLDRYEALHLEATPAPFTVEVDEERAVALVRLAGARGVYPSQRAPIERDTDFDGGPQETEARATVDLIAASRNTVTAVIELARASEALLTLIEVANSGMSVIPYEDEARVYGEIVARQRAALDNLMSALSEEVK